MDKIYAQEVTVPNRVAMTTMNDEYGDGSDHICCDECGFCVTCGDCICGKSREGISGMDIQHPYEDNIDTPNEAVD